MKIILLITLLWVKTFSDLYAVNNLRLVDTRSMGMGENGVTQSTLFNPALLVFVDKRSVSVDYYNRYHVKELGNLTGGVYYPNPLLSTAFQVSTFGYDGYRQTMFRFPLAKQLHEKWSLGISFQYKMLQTELIDEDVSSLAVDIGATYTPVHNLLIGVLITDYPSVLFKNKNLDIESFTSYFLQLGFQWKVINRVLIVGSVEVNSDTSVISYGGIEYIPYDSFAIRMGIRGEVLQPTFGVSYTYQRFTIDASAVYHSVLGFSNGVGIQYSF